MKTDNTFKQNRYIDIYIYIYLFEEQIDNLTNKQSIDLLTLPLNLGENIFIKKNSNTLHFFFPYHLSVPLTNNFLVDSCIL